MSLDSSQCDFCPRKLISSFKTNVPIVTQISGFAARAKHHDEFSCGLDEMRAFSKASVGFSVCTEMWCGRDPSSEKPELGFHCAKRLRSDFIYGQTAMGRFMRMCVAFPATAGSCSWLCLARKNLTPDGLHDSRWGFYDDEDMAVQRQGVVVTRRAASKPWLCRCRSWPMWPPNTHL